MADLQTKLNILRRDLEAAISSYDEVVVVWSGVWMLCHYLGVDEDTAASSGIDLICDTVGPHRTLVMPTYTFAFPRERIYDLKRSKPETGKIPEKFITRPGVRRTRQPVNSYALLGPLAEEAMNLKCTTAWGDDGLMGWLETYNARQIVLGVPWKYCGYFHRGEEVVQIPYRYYKRFSGRLLDDGEDLGDCEETMFVRSLTALSDYDSSCVPKLMAQRNCIVKPAGGSAMVQSALTQDILKCQVDLMRADPYVYVPDPAALRDWVDDPAGKQAEIDALALEQRPAPGIQA